MYVIVEIQFNITFYVRLLERYLAILISHYLRITEHTLVYMKHISKITLKYHRENKPLSLKSYIDLNWVSSEEYKLISRMVYLLNNSVIA
jgi:hypothetical protein